MKITDDSYYDLIISNIAVPSYDTGDNITPVNDRHSLLHIPGSGLNPCDLGVHPYHAFPSIYVLESTISIEKSGIGNVQRNPFLNLLGQGVLIGLIDTGIDYRHPAFLNADGTSRILSIWDQSNQSGPPPEGYTYGSEYGKEQINLALLDQNPLSLVPSTDTNGHGTAMASIIAGSPNLDQSFVGIVPKSELLVVKLKEAKQILKNIFMIDENKLCYQESDIMLAVRYLFQNSQWLNRPIVICVALGTSQGGHDGFDALGGYLNYLTRLSGISLVISAGNEGNKNRHYFSNIPAAPYYRDFELQIGEQDKDFSMEIWPYAPDRLTIDISTPSRESTQRIYPVIGECRQFNFIFTPSTIWVNNILFEEETGDQLILIRFQNTAPGIWYFRVQSIEEQPFSFHAWLPAGHLISDETSFLNPNPDTTITSPGNAPQVLTVTAYNQFNNSILSESSRGYTRNNLIKPTIAAPGYQLPCAAPGNRYGTATGTGAAAAHTAGAAAMVMEWAITKGNYTSITGNDINRLMIRGATRNSSQTYPNSVWGYGQLQVTDLFEQFTSV